MRQMYPRAHFVQGVDGLVGEETVIHIPVCQPHTGIDCLVCIAYMMVSFISLLDIMEYLERLFCRGRFYYHFLEPTLQRAVFLYRVSVLVERGGTYALYRSSCQSRLHDVGSIHAPRCTSGSDHGVYLVDENNDVRILLQFFQQCTDAFLKLSAILGACHDGSHIEVYQSLVKQYGRCTVLRYHLCQTLHDGTFAHTGLSYQDRVVLLAAAENLCHAHDFFLASHYGVQLALGGCLGQVDGEIVKYRSLASLSVFLSDRLSVLSAAVSKLFLFHLVVLGHANPVFCTAAGFLMQIGQSLVIVHVVMIEHLFGAIVGLIVQDGEQQMLHVHHRGMLDACLEHGKFQDIVGFLVE